ncbi:Undecaprenyl-diphosphatase [Burkholderiales bacterium]|nr:Undecaprenyl-diphosphatase [Burkholderiales bacterium]
MDFLLALKATILGIVEGLTEFLPISSTGHLIVAEDLLGFHLASLEAFTIAIQAAAILAVCWEFRHRLWQTAMNLGHDPKARALTRNVVIAFVPAAVVGVLFKHLIEVVLFHPIPVATAWVVGGFIILAVERAHSRREYAERVQSMDDMSWRDALLVGCAQCAALIPGTSRSGATIIGGLILGLSRRAATEFSFFLAIPTMFGATVYSLYKARDKLRVEDLGVYMISSVFAFIAALIAVRWLLRYIATHDFKAFAWYRIVFGGVIVLTAALGWVDWSNKGD